MIDGRVVTIITARAAPKITGEPTAAGQYPAGHKDLPDAIAAQGVIASEWPPGWNATHLRFLVRNRVFVPQQSPAFASHASADAPSWPGHPTSAERPS